MRAWESMRLPSARRVSRYQESSSRAIEFFSTHSKAMWEMLGALDNHLQEVARLLTGRHLDPIASYVRVVGSTCRLMAGLPWWTSARS